VLAALDAASRARLLLDENQTYQFAHDLIREVVEGEVGAARRLVLHRRIAEALESTPGERAVEVLAYHYSRAGVPDMAVQYLEQAGDRAWTQHANAAAEAYYREAVDGLDRLGQLLASARVREKLGLVLHMAAQNDVTLAVLEQAAEAYRAAEDLESLARVTAQIGLVHQNTGRYEAEAVRLQDLARRLEVRGPSRELVKLYAALTGLVAGSSGHRSEALATSQRAVELARLLGDAQLLGEALTQHGNAHVIMGRFVEAQRALEEAIPLAEASGDLIESLPKALWLLSHVCLRYGDLDRGTRYCERELVITERYGQEVRVVASMALRGLLAYVHGAWMQARRDGEQALAVSQHVGPSWISPFPLLVLGLVSYGEGRWQEAARYLDESVAVNLIGPISWALLAPSVLAEIDLREGHPDRARARLAPLLEAADRDKVDVSLILAPYARACLELGDVASAATIVDRGITQARAQSDRFTLVDALRVQALVALRQEHWTAAEQALEEGLTLARGMPYPYAEARFLRLYGVLHLRQNEPGGATDRLDTALAIFRRLGARWDAERVEEALTVLQAHSG
jgi:tetratricopeptide (TPR) repeat protein